MKKEKVVFENGNINIYTITYEGTQKVYDSRDSGTGVTVILEPVAVYKEVIHIDKLTEKGRYKVSFEVKTNNGTTCNYNSTILIE